MPSHTESKVLTIFSYHLYDQRRRGGMHWICDSFLKMGWRVRFVTCDFSLITRVRGDRRTQFGNVLGRNTLVDYSENLQVGVLDTFFHVVGWSGDPIGWLLDKVTSVYPWPRGRVVKQMAQDSDLVIVESCGALLLVDLIRKATNAPIIYRVSDNIAVVRPVPSLLRAERRAIAEVDAVSLASEILAKSFAGARNLRLDPMGLDKSLFDEEVPNPYLNDGRKKVVISGSSGLDVETLRMAAESFPDWDFIQFGSASELPVLPNLKVMGERPFRELVGWVKFADIGFAPYLARPGFEYQAEHSNRLLQYTYAKLPSIVPAALTSASKPHYIGYTPGNKESIQGAFERAALFDRADVPFHTVLDWSQLADRLSKVERTRPDKNF